MTAIPNDIDKLLGEGAPGFFNADSPVGATVTGHIVEVRAIQSTDFATKKPEVWDDGRPKMLIAITIATNLRNTPDDTGHRGIYIKTWGVQSQALKQAIQSAGGPGATASQVLTPGATFTATFTGTQPSDLGSPTKLYTYQVVPATAATVDAITAPQQAPAYQQPPAQPVQAAQPIQQAPAASPAPPQATAPAVATPQASPVDTAKQLAGLGVPVETIAQQLGLDVGITQQLIAS